MIAEPDPPYTPGDPRLRIRLYVDGQLADEVWIDARDPGHHAQTDAAQDRHMALAAAAHRAGQSWCMEAFDPAEPPHRAYIRFGRTGP